MYVRTTRYSFKDDKAARQADQIYNQEAKPMWSEQKGFHSMSRYEIKDGHKGQQIVVVRFESKDAMDKAREAMGSKREEMLKKLEQMGIKAEEAMELEELT